jgi:hypothetical protein
MWYIYSTTRGVTVWFRDGNKWYKYSSTMGEAIHNWGCCYVYIFLNKKINTK